MRVILLAFALVLAVVRPHSASLHPNEISRVSDRLEIIDGRMIYHTHLK